MMLMQLAGCKCSRELGDIVSTAPTSALTADKWILQRGARYRAVFQLNMWDAAEAYTALQDTGFQEIKVYTDAKELPPDWPVSYDDPSKDASPAIDTIMVRAELLWPKNDADVNRRIKLSNSTAIVLKAWRLGTAPDPRVDPKPDPNPPEPPAPPAPPAEPTSDSIETAVKVGLALGGLVIGGVVVAVFLSGKS